MDEIWQYADRTRTQLGTADAPVTSYTGLWLLLALVAPAAQGRAITEALGCPPEEAREVAEKLIAEAHPTVAAALGAWLADWVKPTTPLPVTVEPLPNQETLDAWAAEHTRGLIQTMPVTVRPETMLLLATALVTTEVDRAAQDRGRSPRTSEEPPGHRRDLGRSGRRGSSRQPRRRRRLLGHRRPRGACRGRLGGGG